MSHNLKLSEEEMLKRSETFLKLMKQRRSIRDFSDKKVPDDVLEKCLLTANTAPSGANMQPWHFVVVSDADAKHKIREGAEKEEYAFYHGLAGDEWLDAISNLGTNEQKPYLDKAPHLIVVFAEKYGYSASGEIIKHYYVNESVNIAIGFLVTALHNAGLATLTYTPPRMGFLKRILKRPDNERPVMIVVTGYPAEEVTLPDLSRKNIDDISTYI